MANLCQKFMKIKRPKLNFQKDHTKVVFWIWSCDVPHNLLVPDYYVDDLNDNDNMINYDSGPHQQTIHYKGAYY